MRILFDQGTPVGIRVALSQHIVRTAHEQGWSTLLNGELLRAAQEAGFDVLLTTDNHLLQQQNLKELRIAIVVLDKNRWSLIPQKLAEIVAAVEEAQPGSSTVVKL